MLKIEKIKKEIKNYDTNNNVYFGCYLANFESNIDYEESNCFKEILCSECLRLSLLNLLEEYKETVKLSKFEYEYLKVAKKEGFNFIARDKSNRLYGFEKQPTKGNATWGSRGDYVGMFKSTFSFVQWENEEPWNIDNILANCEVIEDE
jgi:hypothetical protein